MMNPRGVLIVGASRGIGFALAKHFHGLGDHVCIVGRGVEVVRASAQLVGSMYQQEDVREFSTASIDRILLSLPRLDVVIAPAATRLDDTTSTWEQTLMVNTNVLGAWRVARAAIERSVKTIVLFAGAGVGGPRPGQNGAGALYAATKAAVVQMTECLAHDHPGVKINAVAPGQVATQMTGGVGDSPDAAVRLVHWMCSDECRVSGRLISVRDGGYWSSGPLDPEAGKLRRAMP